MIFPLVGFIIMKGSRLQKALKGIYQKCKSCIGRRNEDQEFDSSSPVNTLSVHQILIDPIALSRDFFFFFFFFVYNSFCILCKGHTIA